MSAIGYMCKTDFDCELGEASGYCRVYTRLSELRAECKCAAQCGIVEVRVELINVVQESNYDAIEEEV